MREVGMLVLETGLEITRLAMMSPVHHKPRVLVKHRRQQVILVTGVLSLCQPPFSLRRVCNSALFKVVEESSFPLAVSILKGVARLESLHRTFFILKVPRWPM